MVSCSLDIINIFVYRDLLRIVSYYAHYYTMPSDDYLRLVNGIVVFFFILSLLLAQAFVERCYILDVYVECGNVHG